MTSQTTIETLSNEILLYIFSHLSWTDLLTSLWSLNIRFNSLVCSTLSVNSNSLNTGLVFTLGSSYNKLYSTLFPLLLNSSCLSSCIQRIHFDERNSIVRDCVYQWLFNDKEIIFPNLKSLILTQCRLKEPLIESLVYLIERQLNELILNFAEDNFMVPDCVRQDSPLVIDEKKQTSMMKQLFGLLFSGQCQLKSLQLDINNHFLNKDIHHCLTSHYDRSMDRCFTLRHLDVRIACTCLLENLIERVPNLERLSVHFHSSLDFDSLWETNPDRLEQSNENWFNKIPKLRCFSLNISIHNNREFTYLKWLLNNVNYVEKLEIHLKNYERQKTESSNIWKSFIDANFVRQYCLPDKIINLVDFNFYICSQYELSTDDIETTINSFNNHPFFLDRQWTNVKCLYDPTISFQHLFSEFGNSSKFPRHPYKYQNILKWLPTSLRPYQLYPSLSFILQQFQQVNSNVTSMKIYSGEDDDFDQADSMMALQILFTIKQNQTMNLSIRNVTKIQFGTCLDQIIAGTDTSIRRNKISIQVLAHLISMTVQLKYLVVQHFKWLLYAAQYASEELGANTLSTVRYVEFSLPSCHNSSKREILMCKQLVPFLKQYMPYLQTLHIWRPDDFPWTSSKFTANKQI
ncbi:unnamed protein product [Rotaria socialis]|uniref:F-box domain-containing protein n=2 Tax=Rotaria socialis TaxID=392032 RepID=A0A818QR81_9BILA|nr:unnamed protein product [Rotaria socialis]